MLIVNFKKYKKGKKAVELAKTIEKYDKKALIALLPREIINIKGKTSLRVLSQYVKNKEDIYISKKYNVYGSLLNHSDYPISVDKIKDINKNASNIRVKLIICASSLKMAKKVKSLNPKPWAIAYEDPKLIGTGRSITEYKKDNVKEFVKLLKGTGIFALCGAGVSTAEDVKMAKNLGCQGVLISSALAKVRLSKAIKLLKEIKD